MATVSAPVADIDSWLRYWNARPWPVLRETRERLQPMLRRAERIKSDEIADAVMLDPLLCAQVLKLVNQREKNSLAADVVTIENAIMLYGATAFLERFSHGITVEDVLATHKGVLSAVHAEVQQTRMLAGLARDFANQRIDSRLDEIYLAAVLARVPQLLRLIASIDAAAPKAPGQALPMITGWKLPEALRKLNDFDGELPARVAMQAAVVRGVPALSKGWWQDDVRLSLEKIAEVLNVPVEDVWVPIRSRLLGPDLLAQAAPHWPAARWLPMLPGEWPLPVAPAAPKPSAVQAAVPAPKPVQVPKAEAAPVAPAPEVKATPPQPATPSEALRQAMLALQQAGQQGAQTNQVMQLAFKALIHGLGMRRVMLSLLDSDKITLKARFTHCGASDDPLRSFALTLDPPHLISKLMSKPQSIWLNPQTRAELLGRLPPLFVRQAGDGDFCAMSIFVGARPVGMIYADRQAEQPLDDAAYQTFKQVCTLVSRALADRSKA
ncbi:HDOD domain-containing protein [Andreprevotia lacus DSM 23236]|jgi:hypothetical protein|uniref:HDOD domain-containing protein n=1 Tax=Andreprevotia lacus DSM 23236 TaxID=1121001 RepID=A0A1W1XLS1_9NEIS|nr:HDOD domain-containing protein [Andreprevotia lacus]SMC24794.1 HDOD domain-containing protein [Andreprevotia lacus DSM 23236]